MKKIILHNKPALGKEEIKAAARAIKSGWVAQGLEAEKFENEMCDYLGRKKGEAAVLSSGTAALYVSLVSLGIKRGDEVIIPTYTCSAVLNAVLMAGAKPILVDINEEDLNISFEGTKKKINKRTKAVIITHTFGLPADIDKFLKLNIPIIEDCAQAIGAKYKGKPVGTFGKAAIFSFYASKMLSTGYGGMVFSKDKNFINKVKDYREFDCRKDYKLRFNFQTSDINAAIGREQLKKFPKFLKRRKAIARAYYKILSGRVWPSKDIKNREPNYYRFLIRTDKALKIKKHLEKNSIKTIVPIETYELLHRYLKKDFKLFPVSEKVSRTTLSLPIFPSLSDSDIEYIIKTIKQYDSKH